MYKRQVACSPSYLAGAGWDWMPYVPGRLAGITGNAYLVVTGDVAVSYTHLCKIHNSIAV